MKTTLLRIWEYENLGAHLHPNFLLYFFLKLIHEEKFLLNLHFWDEMQKLIIHFYNLIMKNQVQ